MELATGTAVWYHGGQPPVAMAIRWVLLRDPHGRCEPQALLATRHRPHGVRCGQRGLVRLALAARTSK